MTESIDWQAVVVLTLGALALVTNRKLDGTRGTIIGHVIEQIISPANDGRNAPLAPGFGDLGLRSIEVVQHSKERVGHGRLIQKILLTSMTIAGRDCD